MRPVWLHIGAPKAGSTALQVWCVTNRAALARAGLIYPGREERHQALLSAHHPAPETLAYHRGRDRARARAFEALRLQGMADDIARHAQATVLLSNEHLLSYAEAIDLAGLRDRLATFGDTQILVYARDPLAAMAARSFEEIRSGGATYEDVAAHPKPVPIAGLETIFRVFGADRITLRAYEAALAGAGEIVADAMGLIAPELDLSETVDIPRQNPTPTLEAALLLAAQNRALADTPRPARRVTPEDLAGIGRVPFALPRAAILAARPALEAQYDLLARHGLPLPRPDWDAVEDPQSVSVQALFDDIVTTWEGFGPKHGEG